MIPYHPTRAGVVAVVLAATLCPAACGDATLERREPAGVVETGGSESSDAVAPDYLEARWLVPPDPAGDPPLAAPIALAVDEGRGRLYVLETQPPVLRVYDLEGGTYIGALGRAGDGPGEYRHPIAVAVEPGGLVAVLSMSGRVTFWGGDGTLAGTVQAGAGMATDILAAGADSFYLKTNAFPPEDVAEFRVAAVDTVFGRPFFSDLEVPGTVEPGRPYRNHSYAVAATAVGDLLLAPPGRDYTILRIGRTGEVIQEIGRPEVAPLERSEEEIEAVRDRVRKAFAAMGRAPPSNMRVPMYRSHVARLATAPDTSIWALTQRGDSSIAIIDRFNAAGEYSGSLTVELRASELAVSSAAVYLLAHSTFDVAGIAFFPRTGEIEIRN
jgi:hypothetical protein